jgi:hypothetical protein
MPPVEPPRKEHMKTSSIRIRITEEDKARIAAFADRTNRSLSEILRTAAAAAIKGEVVGEKERRVCAKLRCSANSLLEITEARPVHVARLRAAVADLRVAACEVVRCP